jgi:hypothetical protein
MANLSLIMRRNIMISRCLDLFVQIPKHSTTGYYLFQKLCQHEILDERNSRFDLYHIVKILLLSLFFIRLDGDGPAYYLDGHSQGLRSSRHVSQYLLFFFLLLHRRLKIFYSKCLVSINYNPTSFEQDSR